MLDVIQMRFYGDTSLFRKTLNVINVDHNLILVSMVGLVEDIWNEPFYSFLIAI